MRSTLALVALCGLVFADLYLHNPRGSNDRLNEANTNRNNNNRLFDSQNNAKGGYCYGPAMSYYEGSQLSVEWASQHGCGSNKLHCQIILQYMCGLYNNPAADDASDIIRDGGTTNTPPATSADDAATTQDDAVDGMGFEYGQHENFYYYKWCTTRSRNQGLYTADRNVNNNAGAGATRQNNNGGQSGYECSEERDYYPYWHPAPWKDIAVVTDDTSLCKYFQAESQNVKAKGYCVDPTNTDATHMYEGYTQYNTPTSCTQNGMTWQMMPAWGIPAPDCVQTFFQRDNHLGNVGGNNGYNAYYNWTLPTHSQESCIKNNNCNCVFRLRYNISSNDFSGYVAPFADATNNAKNSFLYQDPDTPGVTDTCTGDGTTPCNVTLAIDTSQFARTFQDRSYVFHLLKRPASILATSRIFNLNVKGKRGNIVQTYPATEYDFHPNDLQVRVGDYIHFQWTGCDTNPAGSAGEGLDGTDRTNIVQIENLGANVPASEAYLKKNPLFESPSLRYRMAFIDQGNCTAYDPNANGDQDPQNCMNLNAAGQHFDAGALQMNRTGIFYYMNSRNNNFTNRGQKGTIVVSLLLPTWGIVMVSIGSALFAGSAGTAGAMIYAKSHPDSKIADLLSKF